MLTSLGDANDIPLLMDSWNCVTLDGRRPGKETKFQVLEDNRMESSFGELNRVSSQMKMVTY